MLLVFCAVISLGFGLNLYGEFKYEQVQKSWNLYTEKHEKLDHLLIELQEQLGYGGFIHNFKNLLIRKEISEYDEKITSNIEQLNRIIEGLEKQVGVEHKEQILIIRNTVDNYILNFKKLKHLIQQGAAEKTIDNIVAIDDTSALKAFDQIDDIIQDKYAKTRLSVDEKYDQAHQFMMMSRFVFAFILIVLAVSIYRFYKGLIDFINRGQRARKIFVEAGIGTWEFDSKSPVKIRWGYVTRKIFEVPDNFELNANTAIEFYKEIDYKNRIKGFIDDALKNGNPFEYEAEIVTFKENVRWIKVKGYPFYENGVISKVYGLLEDITEHKKELELIKNREEVLEASRAKSEFLASMSHELRTPLNAIMGFSQLLELECSDLPEQLSSARQINKSGKHLLTLINDVLDLSAVEAGKLQLSIEDVGMQEIVESCFVMLKGLADKKRITLECQNLEEISVCADNIRLKQVLINLISNAIKYNDVGGSVTVNVELSSTKVRINVMDTGYGIESDEIPHLFEEFNRLGRENSEIEGTGIGLSLTQKLVFLMNGTVGVESKLNEGSCFWVELPRGEQYKQGDTDFELQNNLNNKPLSKSFTALYIEDNPSNIKLMQRFFTKIDDSRLITAHRPSLGMEVAHLEEPDVILLDINLPEMDGYEVFKQLKQDKVTHDIPVIAITANAMPRDIKRGKDAGFNGYLTKPLDLNLLKESIENILDKT